MTGTWREFWDRPHRIYVNDRHRQVHYRRVAADLVAEIPNRDATVLDYGCGEALEAQSVAAACGKLFLCESAATLRAALQQRHAGNPKITVLAPEDVATLAGGSLDLVVANSVIQYLSRDELAAFAAALRGKLAPGGRLILADVIPPGGSLVADVTSLLRTAAANGFFLAALTGLAATFVSDYRRLRRQVGLTTYRESEIAALLGGQGYETSRRPRNFGFNRARMTLVAMPKR